MMVLSVLPMVQKNVFVHSDTLTRLTKKSFSLLLTEFQNKRIPKKTNKKSVIYKFVSEAVTQRCSLRKGVLRNFEFTGKHLCKRLFFNKVAGLNL